MNENSLSGWSGLGSSGPYNADNASLSQAQDMGDVMAGAGMGYAAPPMASQVGNYGGGVSPSPVNGYPMFSSPDAGPYSPSGYADSNPVASTPSVTLPLARSMVSSMQPLNPAQPVQATQNPWNIKQSSTSGAFDYPLPGSSTPPPKIGVL